MLVESSLKSVTEQENLRKTVENYVTLSVFLCQDNLDGYLNFFSIGGDGRVTNWTIVKTTLWFNDKLVLPYSKSLSNGDNLAQHLVEGPRTIAFKPDDENIFLVGTDEGEIYLATTEFSTTFLMKYAAHTTPINSIVWNTFYPALFLSCAAEQTVYLWHKDLPGEQSTE